MPKHLSSNKSTVNIHSRYRIEITYTCSLENSEALFEILRERMGRIIRDNINLFDTSKAVEIFVTETTPIEWKLK